jgi:hypothetical protein
MGKEMHVALGVIGVLLILFVAMVAQRLFWDPSDETVPAQIPTVMSDLQQTRRVQSQPTIVIDPLPIDTVPAENPRNPRKNGDDAVQPTNSRSSNGGFRPIRAITPSLRPWPSPQ